MSPSYLDTHESIVYGGALVAESRPTLCNPADCSLPGSSISGFSVNDTGVGCLFLLQGKPPDPGIKPGSPARQADSFPTELPGKPLLYKTYITDKDLFYHRLSGHEFEEAPGDGEGQGSLACCRPWGVDCRVGQGTAGSAGSSLTLCQDLHGGRI